MIGEIFKRKRKEKTIEIKTSKAKERYNQLPEGVYKKCKKCEELIYAEALIENEYKCPNCGYLFRLSPENRINSLVDDGSFSELFSEVESKNPIDFEGYEEKIKKYQEKSNQKTAILTGVGKIDDQKVAIGCMNPYFMMGSMGSALGEKLTKLIEYATAEKLPLIIFTASGGARMQEGVFSLMQMAKTSAALKRHSNVGLLYIAVLTDPTTGGVSASFAMLGDIIIAEPKALIGFAGPRVIKQTIKRELPEGFQRSEYLLEHGFIDKIVPRDLLKNTLDNILKIHGNDLNE